MLSNLDPTTDGAITSAKPVLPNSVVGGEDLDVSVGDGDALRVRSVANKATIAVAMPNEARR